MGVKDLLVTPIYLIIFFLLAYILRPYFTDKVTKKYFIPALSLKFIGAISLGLIYQFYYGGGDTFNYYTHGSYWIWEAFLDDPKIAFKLMMSDSTLDGETFQYSQNILFYHEPKAYFVIKVAAFFGFFTFHTYSVIALCFAIFCFGGQWALYSLFVKFRPEAHKWLALSVLFVPSVFFWGSGILKDTLTLGALGWFTHSCYYLFIQRKNSIRSALIFLLSAFILVSIKVYIMMCFIPACVTWIYFNNIQKIKSKVVKLVVSPVLFALIFGVGVAAINYAGSIDEKYALANIPETSRITAYDIRYYTGKTAGSGYDIGELDGTFLSMFKLLPQAINVSLFRPYLWEVSNPLMLISSLESMAILIFTIAVFRKVGLKWRSVLRFPEVKFCLIFSLTFAFAVGISTYNFGTLVRYKIPLMPYYLSALTFAYFLVKEDKLSFSLRKGDSK